MKDGTQLFIIDDDVWSGLDVDTVTSTADAMADAGLNLPPCERFDVLVKGTDGLLVDWFVPGGKQTKAATAHPGWDRHIELLWRFDATKPGFSAEAKIKYGPYFLSAEEMLQVALQDGTISRMQRDQGKDRDEVIATYIKTQKVFSLTAYTVLVVLLATKNAVKETKENKLARLGIGKKGKNPHRYITTIKIGKITETMHGDGHARGPVRPHLRRGHVRNQRFGEGLKEIKQIFIHPVFVNADQGWIDNQREAYRLKM